MKKYILLSLFAQFTLINFYATSLKAQPGIGHIQVAFQDAARNNRLSIVKFLIENGADREVKN